MTDPSSMTLRSLMIEVTNVLSSAGLRLSPSMFSADATPKNLIDLSYVVNLQSRDAGIYRGGSDEVLRMEHTLTVTVAKILKPLDQFSSQLDALDIQEKAIKAMLQAGALSFARASWKSANPTVTSTREHLLIDLVFQIDMDWSWDTGAV